MNKAEKQLARTVLGSVVKFMLIKYTSIIVGTKLLKRAADKAAS